ncbi:C-mannosyltransferase dpy-19 homolog [Haematobia irritans]|uniref:C-mannosyltransferase dpy-19 homolog n=1 Tax=Haematobia irritans TaxID=7368 RepID=UPI003F4F4DFF
MKETKLVLMLAQSLIGTGFFFLYVHHVRYLFENRTNMAHLTQLERESLFRREDALYHSFYKTLTEAPDFWTGCKQLMNVTTIEYPHSVNVLSRFHVLPEITIGFLYHLLRSNSRLGILSLLSCWRSDDIRLTLEHGRCEGQALQFYFECVWLLGGITVLIIYMYGLLLSRNIFGGIYAVVSYIMFHSFASKIYERPMARENFAFPAIFVQMFYLCICIHRVTETKKYRMSVLTSLKLIYLTTVSLLCWQFSAIIFASQILILMLPWSITDVPDRVVGLFTMDYVLSQLMSNFLAYYYSFGNHRYLFGWQLGPLVGLSMITAFRLLKKPLNRQKEMASGEFSLSSSASGITENTAEFLFKTIPLGILISLCSQSTIMDILEMFGLAKPLENTYGLYRDLIIHWVLQAKVNFVTSLAACNPEYERMHWYELWGFIKNLVVKPYCLYGVVIMARFFRKWRKSTEVKEPNTEAIERAKNYVLEDFLEENHISMSDMSKKETEARLNECFEILAKCDYDYERYKKEKTKHKKDKTDERSEFLNDINKLKEQIHEQREQQQEKKIENDGEGHHGNNDNSDDPESDNRNNKRHENNHKSTNNRKEENDDNATDSTSPNITNTNSEEKENPSLNGKKSTASKASRQPLTKDVNDSSDTDYDDDENTCNYRSLHYIYSFLQMAVFTLMGLSIRKLFFLCFTQGCVLGSTICSSFMSNKNRRIFWTAYLLVFLTSVVNPGIKNIQEEYYPSTNKLGHDDLDTMLEWIKMNTEKDAVFAGPIDIIGTVHLSTRRPIVNHAHLEMKQISERTEHVYSIFSRQQSSDIYNQCSQLKIQYLIITVNDCENHISDECDLLSIWDDVQPAYRKYPQFCSELAVKNIPSFLKVFTNDYYAIIKMFSQSVQINLKYNKMPEKHM